MLSSSICSFSDEQLLPFALEQSANDHLKVHLATCSSCQQRLKQLQSESATLRKALDAMYGTVSATPLVPSPPIDRTPGTIGKYFIVGILGRGAQGTVYRGVHPFFHREIVIKHANKAIRPNANERDPLLREGQTLSRLEHPHIVRVIDLDFHDDRPFLVMEYHRGVNLEQFVSRRKLQPREIAGLLAPLARALGEAHRLGIVHQDVKPGNLLIDENGKPFVIDFGLSRLRDLWSAPADQPDGGTAAYMAPEQARGDTAKIGPASDVFALGGVLYFLLTGHPPFQAADWHEAMKRAGRCEFDRDALRASGIPRKLAAICLKAMAAEPAERYRRAEDMAAALERTLRRPRQWLWLGAAASLLIVAFFLWRFWPTPSPSVEPTRPPMEQLLITAVRRTENGKADRRELLKRGPLKPGDILELGYDVPHGYKSAFFLVNAAGEVRELEPLHVNMVGAFDRIRFPAAGDWRVEGAPGPILFLACANRETKPALSEVRGLIQENGDKPLRLPTPEENFLFVLTGEETLVLGDEPREVIETPFSRLRDRLERLRKKASGEFDYVWGVALPMR